jgi:hypothetical protein
VFFPGADRILSATGVPSNANSLLFGLYAGGVWRSDTAGNAASTFFAPTVTAAQADFSTAAATTAVNVFTSVWDLNATSGSMIYAPVGNRGMHYANDNPGLFRYTGSLWQGIRGDTSAGAPFNIVQETNFDPGLLPVYSATINAADDNMVYTGLLGGANLQRRVAGPSWQNMASMPPIRKVVPSTLVSSRVLALTFGDKPYVSSSSGASGTYSQVSVSQTGFNFLVFYAAAENPTNASNWVAATNKGIFRSTNAGANWSRVATPVLATQAVTAVGFRPDGRAFAGTWSGHRYCSADGGANWTALTTGVVQFNAGINAIRVINGQVYYLTDGAGAYRESGTC